MAEQRPLTIALVAGETSGDILRRWSARLKPRIQIRAVGVAGPLKCRRKGASRYEMEELAVMGIVSSARSPASLARHSRRFDPPLTSGCVPMSSSASTPLTLISPSKEI
ncbi:hypothetical protein MJ561_05920 [Klebsiella pneumoniae]|nr:hypothetical protein MJ561_05920 [Klebsiella pneumoniae]